MEQVFAQPLIISPGDGTQLSNSTVATSILPVTAKYTFEPHHFNKVGKTIAIIAKGRMSNVVTTPGTLTLDLRLGGTVFYTTGAIGLNIVAKTNLPWHFEVELTCRAIGATGNFMGIGLFQSECVVGSPLPAVGGSGSLVVPVTAPAVGSNVDLTTSLQLDMFATFSVNTNPTNLTLHQFKLLSLN